MPEGDSIRNVVADLGPHVLHQVIESALSRWPSASFGLAGKAIVALEPHGKNLWLVLDDDSAIRIHLAMRGRWRWLPAGEAHRGSVGNVSLLLRFAHGTAVCTGAPTVQRAPPGTRPMHPVLAASGPDVLADELDLEGILDRIPSSPAATIAEVLLDQRVAAGIGNVYKCELLFLKRLDPFRPPATMDREVWADLYVAARELMKRNLREEGARGPRKTTPAGAPGRHWVYGRGGRPCPRCGSKIRVEWWGDGLPRHTWWCPTCQPPTPNRQE